MKTRFTHTSFGALWHSDILLNSFDINSSDVVPLCDSQIIGVRRVAHLLDRVPLRRIHRGFVYRDGLRFVWDDEVTFDLSDGLTIDYCPGMSWTGTLPAGFYGTMAALTLAWRGALPYHASAVEVAGKAVLIIGSSGAGKSTLTAELLERGARFIGDDLTVLGQACPNAPVMAFRGRPALRLHRESAQRVPASDRHPVAGDSRGKWEVRPHARSMAASLPVAGFIALNAPDGLRPRRASAMLLARHLFRPQWLHALPGHAARMQMTLAIADTVPCFGLSATVPLHRDAAAIDTALRAIDIMVGA